MNAQSQIQNTDALLTIKNRLLMEKRFHLNKSNTKWISVGFIPGFPHLDGREKMTMDIVFYGDKNTSVACGGIDGFKSIFFSFFSQLFLILLGCIQLIVFLLTLRPSLDIRSQQLSFGSGPIFKNMNHFTQKSICMGIKSVEELLRISRYILLWSEYAQTKVSEYQDEFTDLLSYVGKNGVQNASDKIVAQTYDSEIVLDLLNNFEEYFLACVNINNQLEQQKSAADALKEGVVIIHDDDSRTSEANGLPSNSASENSS